MQVTVFGAGGKVGRLAVAELLARGYDVTAFVHRRRPFSDNPRLHIIQGDIYDTESIVRSLSGSHAVISTLSSWGTPRKDVLTAAMTAVIPAMQHAGMRRIVSLTGSEARGSGDAQTWLHRAAHVAARAMAGSVLRDGEQHIRLLQNSALDWTVVRSPVMRSFGSGGYVFSAVRNLPWHTVHRAAVAAALVDQLEDDGRYHKSSPFIHGR